MPKDDFTNKSYLVKKEDGKGLGWVKNLKTLSSVFNYGITLLNNIALLNNIVMELGVFFISCTTSNCKLTLRAGRI